MMERETSERAGANRPQYRPTPLAATAPSLRRMVVIGEDSRFWTHHGIDPAEIADALGLEREGGMAAIRAAWVRRNRLRGASTITQQLAKNLYLSPSRSLPRKLKEAVTALRLEAALPKARILELYLSAVEWGPGIWGAEAASHRYFARSASELDDTAAAGLAAALPDPRRSNPAHPSPGWTARRDRILERYYGKLVSVPSALDSEPEPDTAQTGPPPP